MRMSYGSSNVGSSDRPGAEQEIRRLRESGYRKPVLGATRGHAPDRTAKLLGLGCDDVLVMPVDPNELVARISAVSRRACGHADGRVVIGDIVIHLDGREPELKGVPMRLSNRESAIFLLLAKYHGRVVARETIYNAVYGLSDKQPFDKVIDVFICKLRRKLEAGAGHPYIRTIFGRGYMIEDPTLEPARMQRAADALRRLSDDSSIPAIPGSGPVKGMHMAEATV